MASAPSQELPSSSGDAEGFWRHLGGQPAPLLPPFPCYPALPCYGWLRPPPLGFFAQPVSPLPWAGTVMCAGSRVRAEGHPGAKMGPPRESTAALKAWLGGHPRNPYPSKGEKVLLAVVSRMSLTQVSTWFANARRRLKKENRARWSPRDPPGGEDEEEEDEEEEEEEGSTVEGGTDTPDDAQPPGSQPSESPGAAKLQQGLGVPPPALGTSGAQPLPPKPKIWCLAEFATGPQPERPAA